METRIEEIERVGRGLRARRVRFSDGTKRVTAARAVKTLSLESGMSLSFAVLETALEEIEPDLARDRALRLLGYRERSTAELTARLADDGFPAAVVSDVADSLQASGLLDDERFAEHLVRTRAAGGYGRQHIVRELMQNGIDREAAESYFDTTETAASEAERLRSLVAAHPPKDRRERDRLLRKLVAKGFAPGAVLDAMRYAGDADLDSGDDLPGCDMP